MHERIQLLAEQAGMYVDVKGEPWPRWMGAEECEVAYKKFAELIVKQCADVLLDWKKEPFPFDPDLAASLIKEHFGVEE